MSDTRFHPGHTWVSDSPDCRTGLCLSGTPDEAARKLVGTEYWKRGKTYTVYTLGGPDESPQQHDITV